MKPEESIRKELRLIIRELGLLNYNCLNSGMTLAQAHILNFLKNNKTASFNELLLQLGIDKASLSRILNNLVSKEYIKMERSSIDKRMKSISIQPLGLHAIDKGEDEANKYINEILQLGNKEVENNLYKTLREFRILALKKNLLINDSRIIIEKLPDNYIDDAIGLATEVFTYEQNIPKELIPVKEKLKPIWWGARVGEDIVGVTVCWRENDEYHWGRFAIDKSLRGLGIGKKIILLSLTEIFDSGADKIFIDARDITVKMLREFGGRVIGKTINFYGDSVTTITIERDDFYKIQIK